jgi:hypothetical protein
MVNNKNNGKIHDLSEKIANEEGLKVEELEQDISKQMGHSATPKAQDLTHRVAHNARVSTKEINKDITEQMGHNTDTTVSTSTAHTARAAATKHHNLWLYVALIAAAVLAIWWIFGKYF